MFEYQYGIRLSDDQLSQFRRKLIQIFAQEYDIKSNRLWNCLRLKAKCLDFEEASKLAVPVSVLLYLERQNEVYRTRFKDVCKYVEELEPWEYIDAYVFDDTFSWLFVITHEELKCLVVGLQE